MTTTTKTSFIDDAVNIVRGAGGEVSNDAKELLKQREAGKISREEYIQRVVEKAKKKG